MDVTESRVEKMECTYAVVGGGIAGVSCAEGLSFLDPEESIILITASPLVKAVTNVVPLGKTLMHFDVEEKSVVTLADEHKMLRVIQDTVVKIDTVEKLMETRNGKIVSFKMLCLCTGARPKLIAERNDFVVGIRDTESVLQFSRKLRNARRAVVVGNGGIATEIVHEVKGVEMVWVIKDKHISATFVDPGAAEFFLSGISRSDKSEDLSTDAQPTKRMRYVVSDSTPIENGAALGPDWHSSFDMSGGALLQSTNVHVEYECEVSRLLSPDERNEPDSKEEWPIYAQLTNGKIVGCDLIISATGVVPNSDICGLENLERAEDAGLSVDWKLETSQRDVYAAGDVCTADWPKARHWFQMRLWTQAHQMGRYAAKSMVSRSKGEDFLQDFCFELFTHVTKFFNYKVVLLGLYNGQTLGKNYEILLRITKEQEYVKIVLQDGKMQGAVLIGETNLEEMCENLILNQLDLSVYGEDLLNPDIDIEDYFD
ncbi:PREDICTED: pyridine nucleotide-disulfide oxidoreductase domain-containing protein 1 [Dinoponera quadriceps]|uniref:Pyridine nucleotide-disulfide oxidoreductase domain-containing protein 1 n=1 Tax=Dinoponera quadriceps TaxID=609295 RepID=A0A6P3WS03_DINQU|nr:PREDICTED: pyridine nucleotide-disulfide oxidoreductase domain-containing protein 1 [Dinoponera quadriceps]